MRSHVLAEHWVALLAGSDLRARSFVRRAYAKYQQMDAEPWIDLGGEG